MAREPRTIRELIYWEYAKLIAGSAAGSRTNFRFVAHTYQKLVSGQIEPSSILTENQHLFSSGEICAYCGAIHKLQWEHIVPRAIGGPDTFDNLVRACAQCNLAKGARDPYQWYEATDMDGIPRIVLGKFLKLVFREYAALGVLDSPEYMQKQDIKRVTLSGVFTRRVEAGTDPTGS